MSGGWVPGRAWGCVRARRYRARTTGQVALGPRTTPRGPRRLAGWVSALHLDGWGGGAWGWEEATEALPTGIKRAFAKVVPGALAAAWRELGREEASPPAGASV